jgi:peptidoglycan hydrolase-like protein with peptidoglycan-binding domain
LNTHGYNAGAVDGLYGKNTQAAVNRALADNNVSEDIKNKLRAYQNRTTFVPTRQRSTAV